MENLTPTIANGKKILNSYGVGRFTIDNIIYNHHILINGDNIWQWHFNGKFDDEFIASLQNILAQKPELLIIGCGAKMRLAPAIIRAHLMNICPTEFMSTAAAAHTYAYTLAEGRNIAAALHIIE